MQWEDLPWCSSMEPLSAISLLNGVWIDIIDIVTDKHGWLGSVIWEAILHIIEMQNLCSKTLWNMEEVYHIASFQFFQFIFWQWPWRRKMDFTSTWKIFAWTAHRGKWTGELHYLKIIVRATRNQSMGIYQWLGVGGGHGKDAFECNGYKIKANQMSWIMLMWFCGNFCRVNPI